MSQKPKNLAQYIDHTLLRPEATEAQVRELCEQAKQYEFKTVCLEQKWLALASSLLKETQVWPITVVAFPSGNATAFEKAEETTRAIKSGAKEIDMVLHRPFLHERKFSELHQDISSVVQASIGFPVKVILETSELSKEEIVSACAIAKMAGAAYVKTSTGFSKAGATIEDVALMRSVVGSDLGVKASGGIRTLDDALNMIEAGATRLGMSASVAVIEQWNQRKGSQ